MRAFVLMQTSFLAGSFILGLSAATRPALAHAPWAFAGDNIGNSRGTTSPLSPRQIRPTTLERLKLKWSLKTAGDVSATPTVDSTGLYVPDWAGHLYRVNSSTGAVIWDKTLSDYNNGDTTVSRNSPAIGARGEIIIGIMRLGQILSIDKQTGSLNWSRKLSTNPFVLITGSPVVYGGKVFIGLSSSEEVQIPNGSPAMARGAVYALDEATGATRWSFTTVPSGYTGGSVTGGVTVDPSRSRVYVGTGNNYTVPSSVSQCVVRAGSNINKQRACLDPRDYVDAVLALDISSGALKWSRLFGVVDIWNAACNPPRNKKYCPDPVGPDHNFLSGPNLIKPPGFAGSVRDDLGHRSSDAILGAGQKSGMYWGINPDTGGLFWQTNAGPGPIQWGSAIDLRSNNIIVANAANRQHNQVTLLGRNGQHVTTNGGAHTGIQASTGKILWQVKAYGKDLATPSIDPTLYASVTTTNFLAFTGSSSGYFEALSTSSGLISWKYNSGATVMGSPAFYNDTVYWGTGYRRTGATAPRLFAFDIH